MINQQPGERCYHIFYQLLAGADNDLLSALLLSRQVKSYHFLENSEVSVDNVDDASEFKATMVHEFSLLVCAKKSSRSANHSHI